MKEQYLKELFTKERVVVFRTEGELRGLNEVLTPLGYVFGTNLPLAAGLNSMKDYLKSKGSYCYRIKELHVVSHARLVFYQEKGYTIIEASTLLKHLNEIEPPETPIPGGLVKTGDLLTVINKPYEQVYMVTNSFSGFCDVVIIVDKEIPTSVGRSLTISLNKHQLIDDMKIKLEIIM